jgi:hypothetical protein
VNEHNTTDHKEAKEAYKDCCRTEQYLKQKHMVKGMEKPIDYAGEKLAASPSHFELGGTLWGGLLEIPLCEQNAQLFRPKAVARSTITSWQSPRQSQLRESMSASDSPTDLSFSLGSGKMIGYLSDSSSTIGRLIRTLRPAGRTRQIGSRCIHS